MATPKKLFRVVVSGVARGATITQAELADTLAKRYPLTPDARMALEEGRSAVVREVSNESLARRAATLIIKLGADVRIESDEVRAPLPTPSPLKLPTAPMRQAQTQSWGANAATPAGGKPSAMPSRLPATPEPPAHPGASAPRHTPKPLPASRSVTPTLNPPATVATPVPATPGKPALRSTTPFGSPALGAPTPAPPPPTGGAAAPPTPPPPGAADAATATPASTTKPVDPSDDFTSPEDTELVAPPSERRTALLRCEIHGLLFDPATQKDGCIRCQRESRSGISAKSRLRDRPRLWLALGLALSLGLGSVGAIFYASYHKSGPLLKERIRREAIRNKRLRIDDTRRALDEARAKVRSVRQRGIALSALIWLCSSALLMFLWHRFL